MTRYSTVTWLFGTVAVSWFCGHAVRGQDADTRDSDSKSISLAGRVASDENGQDPTLGYVEARTSAAGRDRSPWFDEDRSELLLRQQLGRPITEWDFEEEPFRAVLEKIYDEYQIFAFVHRDADLTLDTPITAKLQDVSLRTALAVVLDAHSCNYCIRDGMLLIGYPPQAMSTRIFQVPPRLQQAMDGDELLELLRTSTGMDMWGTESSLKIADDLLVARNNEPALHQLERLLQQLETKLNSSN